jgi:zinc transporter
MNDDGGLAIDSDHGLVNAFELDGRGGGRALGWDDLANRSGSTWIHLDRSSEKVAAWLVEQSGLDPIVVGALLAEETRPRASAMPGGLLLILRGVNLNPGADPEDMVSLRAWLEKGRLITLRRRRIMAVQEVRDCFLKGTAPKTPAATLIAVIRGLVARAGTVVEDVDDRVSAAEDKLLTSTAAELRRELSDGRRVAIMLRRYLAPQRDTLSRLGVEHKELFDSSELLLLREASDGMARLVEDLDAARDRAAVLHEELSTRLADTMNRNMYLLSIVASIFLPLGLITGLFGINVGGMPWIEDGLGFGYVSASLLVIGAFQYWILKKLRVL